MDPRTRPRRWRLVPAAGTLAVLVGTAGPVLAHPLASLPPPAPLDVAPGAAVPLEPTPELAPIEIYYGVRKVAPVAPPAPVTLPAPVADAAPDGTRILGHDETPCYTEGFC